VQDYSPTSPPAPWVLRVRPAASEGDWWRAARRRHDAPAPIGALLRGRSRVEVTPDEANEAITWAERLDEWNATTPTPLFIHQPGSVPAALPAAQSRDGA
jgi:hypothetical protein